MTDPAGAIQPSLVDRVKAILLKPAEEWPRIAADDTPTRDVFMGYILPLAAIAPIAGLIGGQVFGYGAFGFSYKPSLTSGIATAAIGFVLALLNFLALSLVADFLSPRFGGETSNERAFKLVAHASTAAWLVGLFALVPMLGVFWLLGFYSVYLFYTGAGPMLKVPQDRLGPFTAVMFLAAIALNLLVGALTTSAVAFIAGMGLIGANVPDSGTITTPGGNQIDTREIEQLGKRMEDAANGKAPAVDPAKLQALLPETIGAYRRSATESTRLGAIGSAEGKYEDAAGHSFSLRVIDMNAMGAIAGIGSALGVEQNREDASGYERTKSVNGQMQTEAWHTGSGSADSGSGKFGTVVAGRFSVEAEGSAGSIDDLKAAVAAIDPDDLGDLAE